MLDEKTIIETIKQLMKSPNMSSRLRYKLREAIDPEVLNVSWCIEDMEHLAKENEEDGEVLYNRDMFPLALDWKRMMQAMVSLGRHLLSILTNTVS